MYKWKRLISNWRVVSCVTNVSCSKVASGFENYSILYASKLSLPICTGYLDFIKLMNVLASDSRELFLCPSVPMFRVLVWTKRQLLWFMFNPRFQIKGNYYLIFNPRCVQIITKFMFSFWRFDILVWTKYIELRHKRAVVTNFGIRGRINCSDLLI